MIDSIRNYLYPIGFISSLLFGLRFTVQWLASEREKRSLSPPLFWKLSLAGNFLLFVHCSIQAQFPIALIQALHSVLSWRNLNLEKPLEKRRSFKWVIFSFFLASLATISIFILQGFVSGKPIEWLKFPATLESPVSPIFHIIGITGVCALSLRFWIQWWIAEKQKKSEIPAIFWWLSIIGSIISIFYFFELKDWVNLTGPLVAIVPYLRNLFLINKNKNHDREPSVFIFAGEESGDLYGGLIISKLKEELGHLKFFGVGGKKLETAGVNIIVPFKKFQVMGISNVIKRLPSLLKSFFLIKKIILSSNTKLAIFIDSPDFSLRMAKALRKKGFNGKIVQIVAPTVWAYRSKRKEVMARYFDLLLTFFPFEPAHFSDTTLKTIFIGHPIVEVLDTSLNKTKKTIAVFPGSRIHEVRKNLSIQLKAALEFSNNYPEWSVSISLSPQTPLEFVRLEVEKISRLISYTKPIHIVPFDERYNLMKEADFAIAKSGTVSLELALHEVPSIITYELSSLDRMLAKWMFRLDRLPYYCIVNILKQKELFFELIKPPVSSTSIYEKLVGLQNEELQNYVKKECREIRNTLLGEKLPTTKARDEIVSLFHEQK